MKLIVIIVNMKNTKYKTIDKKIKLVAVPLPIGSEEKTTWQV